MALQAATPPSLIHVPLWHGCRSVDAYEPVAKISEGSYGEVFAARDRATGELVALKRMKILRSSPEEGFPLYALREIQALVSMDHRNVVRTREVLTGPPADIPASASSMTQLAAQRGSVMHLALPGALLGAHQDVFVAMDFCPADLAGALAQTGTAVEAEADGGIASASAPPSMSHSQSKEIVMQLLQGLSHLHARGFMHRDLKPGNILLAPDGHPVLCDFGMTRRTTGPPGLVPYTAGKRVVTRWYRAPELLLGSVRYGAAADVWSVGCILAEMLTGRPLAAGRTDTEQANLVLGLWGGLPDESEWPEWRQLPGVKTLHLQVAGGGPRSGNTGSSQRSLRQALGLPSRRGVSGDRFLSELGLDLLEQLLQLNPARRASAAQALRHPWFVEAPRPCGTEGLPQRPVPRLPASAEPPNLRGAESILALARVAEVASEPIGRDAGASHAGADTQGAYGHAKVAGGTD